MESTKTAVSLPKGLFEAVEKLSGRMKVSRSRLFAMALEDFVRRQETASLVEQMNRACDDEPDPSEEALRSHVRRGHRRMIKGQW